MSQRDGQCPMSREITTRRVFCAFQAKQYIKESPSSRYIGHFTKVPFLWGQEFWMSGQTGFSAVEKLAKLDFRG